MNLSESPEITVQTLLALRKEDDAVRLITERLRVKEMGPDDHIRTKHEVKAFVETGDVMTAESIIRHANERTVAHQTVVTRIAERQNIGQRQGH